MIRKRIIEAARAWVGTPYQHQASCRGAGADCLGLIRGVWRDLYGAEPEQAPPYAMDWAEADTGELMRDAARRHLLETGVADAAPGDVLMFRIIRSGPARHAGILSAPGQIIHACSGHAVREEALGPWARRRAYAFRFPALEI
ncbi:MAG: NlpC/P60 family protein [Alphaproteobacteria bacterium]